MSLTELTELVNQIKALPIKKINTEMEHLIKLIQYTKHHKTLEKYQLQLKNLHKKYNFVNQTPKEHEDMNVNFIESCLDFLGVKITEESRIGEQTKIVHLLQDFNNSQVIQFNIYHSFYGTPQEQISLVKKDLTFFETVNKLNELNSNISSYELYYALAKNNMEEI